MNAKLGAVRVKNGALDELKGNIVLRGVIDHLCLDSLLIGPYQREEARPEHINSLVKALKDGGRFPDIEVGIRGNNYHEQHPGVFVLQHACYVIDGFQRLTAVRRFLQESEDAPEVSLGALLHFDTTEEWERGRFKTLNVARARLSPNVLVRNEVQSAVVKSLLSMAENDKDFVLRGKISWGQRMSRGELLGALMVLKVIGMLHSHSGPGMSTKVDQLVASMDKTLAIVGVNIWRANVRTFFDVLDQAFGVRTIAYRDLSIHIKGTFMLTLARLFADHQTFWKGQRLDIAAYDIGKLRTFPIRDPSMERIISAGGSKVNALLYAQLISHLNSGRRTRKIFDWSGQVATGVFDPSGQANASAESDTE
jgi:hypothetical protein